MFVARSRFGSAVKRLVLFAALSVALFTTFSGCTRLREAHKPEMVYVVAKQTYLRDRVAAVSNRVALVANGEPLQVVEHGRRFIKTKTAKGEVGWIEEHMVIDQAAYDQFASLQSQHAHDPVVATGVLRDDLYLHAKPGRDTDRFYLLPENEKLQLLVRASVVKPAPPQGFLNPSVKVKKTDAATEVPAVAMEDWWMVRDSHGQVGWLLARRLDIDVPDEIGGYSEGQKIVGAYILTKVYDSESTLPDKLVPEYVSLTNAYKDGLPYDFDQVRVFTWNVKKHRYETAYRQRNIQGYLPVSIGQGKNLQGQLLPAFTITVAMAEPESGTAASGEAAKPDAAEKAAPGPEQSAYKEALTYELEGGMVRRITPGPPPLAANPKAAAEPGRRRRGRRKG